MIDRLKSFGLQNAKEGLMEITLFLATRLSIYRTRGFASLGHPRFAIYREEKLYLVVI
jgi:hypothetical protein